MARTINFTYFVAPWIGVDVNVASDFAPQSSSAAITRSVSIGSGVKVISSRVKTVRPWAHVLLGRICCTFPQTAFGNSGFAAEVGGGVDLPLHYSWLALRLGSDYFRSQLYAGGQNNVRVNVGVVYHF